MKEGQPNTVKYFQVWYLAEVTEKERRAGKERRVELGPNR
jgi:hypothetical protein